MYTFPRFNNLHSIYTEFCTSNMHGKGEREPFIDLIIIIIILYTMYYPNLPVWSGWHIYMYIQYTYIWTSWTKNTCMQLFVSHIHRYVRLFHSCQALTCSLPQLRGANTSGLWMTNGGKDTHETQIRCFCSKQQLFLPNYSPWVWECNYWSNRTWLINWPYIVQLAR